MVSPLSAGVDHETVTLDGPPITSGAAIVSGTEPGTTAALADEAVDAPMALMARTVNEYEVQLVRPRTMQDRAAAAESMTAVQVSAGAPTACTT